MKLEGRIALKKRLLHGDVARIARQAGVARSTVIEWFASERQNRMVEECAKALAEIRDTEVRARVDDLKNDWK